MYAIVKTGGKQYKISTGDIILVEKIDGDVGNSFSFKEVMMVVDDNDQIEIGRPVLANAQVTAEIVKQTKGDKIIVFKFKKRKGYRNKTGHRQSLTELKITEIAV